MQSAFVGREKINTDRYNIFTHFLIVFTSLCSFIYSLHILYRLYRFERGWVLGFEMIESDENAQEECTKRQITHT